MVRAMCGVQLKNKKTAKDLIWMLGLHKTIDQLAMANTVSYYGDVLKSEDGHFFYPLGRGSFSCWR